MCPGDYFVWEFDSNALEAVTKTYVSSVRLLSLRIYVDAHNVITNHFVIQYVGRLAPNMPE